MTYYNYMFKNQRQNFKSSKRKEVIHKRNPIRLPVDFSTEPFQARREWDDIFKIFF